MLSLSLVMILLSASPSTHGKETKTARAARLMTDVELAQLADLDREVEELRRTPGNTALLTTSIMALSAGVIVPVGAVVVGAVGSIFAGLVGLLFAAFGSTSVLEWIPTLWVAVFAWIPVWGWIAMAAVVAAGAGMLISALTSDAPRRAQVAALQADRRALINAALARPENALLLPVASF